MSHDINTAEALKTLRSEIAQIYNAHRWLDFNELAPAWTLRSLASEHDIFPLSIMLYVHNSKPDATNAMLDCYLRIAEIAPALLPLLHLTAPGHPRSAHGIIHPLRVLVSHTRLSYSVISDDPVILAGYRMIALKTLKLLRLQAAAFEQLEEENTSPDLMQAIVDTDNPSLFFLYLLDIMRNTDSGIQSLDQKDVAKKVLRAKNHDAVTGRKKYPNVNHLALFLKGELAPRIECLCAISPEERADVNAFLISLRGEIQQLLDEKTSEEKAAAERAAAERAAAERAAAERAAAERAAAERAVAEAERAVAERAAAERAAAERAAAEAERAAAERAAVEKPIPAILSSTNDNDLNQRLMGELKNANLSICEIVGLVSNGAVFDGKKESLEALLSGAYWESDLSEEIVELFFPKKTVLASTQPGRPQA